MKKRDKNRAESGEPATPPPVSERRDTDLPGRLLACAVRWMPSERHEWGAAMQTELEQIPRPRERWRFALGCAVTALFPPGGSGRVWSMVSGATNDLAGRPKAAALIGLLCLLPFAAANLIVANRVEPFFSLIRPGAHTSPQEYVMLAIVLLLLPLGAFTALRPALRRRADGRRHFYLANGAIAALLLIAFAAISIGLGSDIYACEVLQIPNCD